MYRAAVEASRWLRWGVLCSATTLMLSSAPAMARAPQKLGPDETSDNPRYAALVVDVNSGATLRQAYADALRHPASLTKIMTLYLLFERVDAGKLTQFSLAISAKPHRKPRPSLASNPDTSLWSRTPSRPWSPDRLTTRP